MWKRFNKPSEKAIGNPILVETTLDERSVSTLNNLHNGAPSPALVSSHGRYRSEDLLKELPSLPMYCETTAKPAARIQKLTVPRKSFETAQTPQNRAHSTASSRYSYPSPDPRPRNPRLIIPRGSSVYPDDVSPPDSPRTGEGVRSRKSSPNVSPITESGSSSRHTFSGSKHYASNVPLPRASQNPGGTAAFISGWRERVGRDSLSAQEARLTRWDDFSGEPSETGKPAQAIPGTTQFDQTMLKSNTNRGDHGEGGGSKGERALKPKPLFGSKIRTVGRKDSAVKATGLSTGTREEWRGVNSRTATAKPLEVKPLPPGKDPVSRYATPAQNWDSVSVPGPLSPTPVGGPAIRVLDESTALPALPLVNTTIKPIVPLKVGRNSPHSPITRGPPVQPSNFRLDMTSPLARNHNNEKKPESPDKQLSIPSMETSPESPSPDLTENQLRNATQKLQIRSEPASRFSATTYNTTIPDSPPDSPQSLNNPPPLPSPPLSILSRKRPIPSSNIPTTGTKTPTRKPTPSQTHATDASKASPTDAGPVDRVAQLEETLNALHRRRDNLQIVLRELTSVVQPSSLAYDMAARQEIKRTVEAMNVESASVAKEIYETGMKLHRAMKRRDEKNMFEPTGLWVRRVTE